MSQRDYQDDPEILPATRLFRRVHPDQLVNDGDTGFKRISSSVFSQIDTSVDIESLMIQIGKTPMKCLEGYQHHKLVAVTAGVARNHAMAVCSDPVPTNPSHGLIYGRKTARIKNGLRDAVEWIIPPEPPRCEENSEGI